MSSFKDRLLEYLNIPEEEYLKLTKKISKDDLESPDNFINMDKVTNRINDAIKNNENIMIYGDYDCDGISATSILVKTFLMLNKKVGYYIPSRYIDGYGLNLNRAKQIKEKGYSLLITVDNGVSCHEAIAYLKENNVDVIITDHHEITGELPLSYSILHPDLKVNHDNLKQCGAYVAFMLSIKLLNYVDDYLLTLAMQATISDMMPLHSHNRNIVKLGLEILNKNKHFATCLLTNKSIIDEDELGYVICPKINAFGRIKEDISVNDMVRFFVSDDEKIKQRFLRNIELVNNQRKDILNYAVSQIKWDEFINDKLIVTRLDQISEGVIGLVASRILNQCNKPCIVLCKTHEGILKGSARSYEGLNLAEAFLDSKEYLLSFGGHAQAGGLSLNEDNYFLFKDNITKYALDKKIIIPEDKYFILNNKDLTYENYLIIKSLSPFGMEFPRPNFLLKINKGDVRYIGNDGQHIKGLINNKASFIGFNLSSIIEDKENFYASGNIYKDDFRGGEYLSYQIDKII